MLAVQRLKQLRPVITKVPRSSIAANYLHGKAEAEAQCIDIPSSTRVERSISYVETDLYCHNDDVVTLKFDKIDRKVVPKQHLLQAKTYVFAPSFQQFVRVPSLIAQADVQSVLDTFCAVRAEGGVRWSRSLMGQRFGYELKSLERAVFPEWFPFFIVNVQPKAENMPLARFQLAKMSRHGPTKYEYAHPSIYYYDEQDWTCLLKKKASRRPFCMARQHFAPVETYNDGLFAAPCGDFVACREHADSFIINELIGHWLSEEVHPVVGFNRLGNFICPSCNRLSAPLYEGNHCDYTFRSISLKRSQNMIAALFADWMRWLCKSTESAAV